MKLDTSVLNRMRLNADRAIGDVLLSGSPLMRSPPRTEVGFVAAVTLGGIKAIADAWESTLKSAGLSLNIHGVFCHGAPQVIAGKIHCELADLLIVVDRRSGKGVARRAALVQAKMACNNNRVMLAGKSTIQQLHLYQNWPLFEFKDSVAYGSAAYSLTGSTDGEAGTFGIINRHLTPPAWTQHQPTPTPKMLSNAPTLGSFIAWMADDNAQAGRSALVHGRGRDDWSSVVDRLLSVTYQKTFSHSPTLGHQRPPRGYSAFLVDSGPSRQLFSSASADGIPPIGAGIFPQDGDPVDAISVFHIEIAEI